MYIYFILVCLDYYIYTVFYALTNFTIPILPYCCTYTCIPDLPQLFHVFYDWIVM